MIQSTKTRKLIIAILVAVALYFLGDWLRSIYGFDPPMVYYIVGNILVLAAFLIGVFLMGWTGFLLFRKLKRN